MNIEINEDIRYLLQRKVGCKNGTIVEFGDVVLGTASNELSDKKVFNTLLSKLLKFIEEYSTALHLYRDNFDSFFQYRAHRERVLALAKFIKVNKNELVDMQPITLSVVFQHLEAESDDV